MSNASKTNIAIAARLKQARRDAGYRTAKQFADAHGIPQSTYANHETGGRGLSFALTKYADLLGASLDWLQNGELASNVKIPVRGLVGAGAEIFPFPDEDAIRRIAAPPGCESGMALEVRGTSMEPVYRDGDVLFPDPRPQPLSTLYGKDCAVEIVDGPRMVKKVLKGSVAGYVRLFSYETNDLSDEIRIVDARPILWVQRRA